MGIKGRSVLEVAQMIVDEFAEAEASRRQRFTTVFCDPQNPKRKLQNYVGVRVALLRELQEATKEAR